MRADFTENVAKKNLDAIRPGDIARVRKTFKVGDRIKTETTDAFGGVHIRSMKIVRFLPYLVGLLHKRTITYGDLVVYVRSGEKPIKLYEDVPQARRRRPAGPEYRALGVMR